MRAVCCLLVCSSLASADMEYAITGKVKSVAKDGSTITITRENGKETTVKIDRGTELRIDGKVKRWDPKTGSLTVDRISGKQTTVQVGRGTEVRLDGKRVMPNRIMAGQEVRVSYHLKEKNAFYVFLFVEIDRPSR